MKKSWIISAVIVLVLLVTAVFLSKKKSAVVVPADSFCVVCTTYPVYLFTQAVVQGTGVPVELLVPAGAGCPHDYSLTPRDLMKLDHGKVYLIENGVSLDDEISRMAQRSCRTGTLTGVLDCSQGLPLIREEEEEEEEHHSDDHDKHHHHHHDTDFNPHIFASPDTAALMVQRIADGLKAQVPAHAAEFEANASRYIADLSALSEEFMKAGVEGSRIGVQHNVFAYLARLCGMKEAVSLHAEENQSPSPAVVAELKESIKEQQVKVLFTEPQYLQDFAVLLAKETGIRLASLDPCASGPEDASPDYYMLVMRKNLDILKDSLKK